jgi:hypothetical protein
MANLQNQNNQAAQMARQMSKRLDRAKYLPRQIPVPTTGGFDMHFSGGSHDPENPPGPPDKRNDVSASRSSRKFQVSPQVSPSVFAQTLQHLQEYILDYY